MALTVLTALGFAAAAEAIQPPTHRSADSLTFRSEALTVPSDIEAASRVAALAGDVRLLELGVTPANAFVDLRTGRFAGLRMGEPLFPGRGRGNSLTWEQFGNSVPRGPKELEAAASDAFRRWLDGHATALGLDLDELAGVGKVAALSDEFVNIYIPRAVGGVAVRDSYLVATIKYGNLILFGLHNWGDIVQSGSPRLSSGDAEAALRAHVGFDQYGRTSKNGELVWLPVAVGAPGVSAIGEGLGYRLAWLIRNDFNVADGKFEALVDAMSGEVLQIRDLIQWGGATERRVQGGVYPVSNDQVGPDGIEAAGWPMPFVEVVTPFGTATTDIGGNLPICVNGNISASLSGPFVRIDDACGASSLSSPGGLDWLSGPNPAATDCTTPGVGGAGNTKSARSGFHELNMLTAMARSHLPNNPWPATQLRASMNIPQACNANYDGTGVNFFRSALPTCRNTGEIAAIFDHEWGHSIDDHDNVPGIALPGEAVADIYASLRLDTSCVGRGFFASGTCSGYGDPCDECSGVRDIDYLEHVSNERAQIAGVPDGDGGDEINNCPVDADAGPCGKETHCEGMAPGEAVWDLWNRELTAPPYSLSIDQAREIGTQLTFRGGSNLTAWYTCDAAGPDFTGGCAAGMGYSSYLAADDDDGNLGNGTPHWVAINNAFDLHKVGCTTDTPVDSGCAGTPAGSPVVTATARDKGVDLSWPVVGDASGYRVYRTDGVFGCNFGKILLASLDSGTLSYQDRGLQNGREYSYQVVAMGAQDECFGGISSCSNATPLTAGGGASLGVQGSLVSSAVVGGDADFFLDNCEVLKLTLPVSNTGQVALTNLQVVSAVSTSHPTSDLLTVLPKTISASMPSCGIDAAVLEFRAEGLTPGGVFEADIEIDADELPGPETIHVVSNSVMEGDFQAQASLTWSFIPSAQGWVTETGTFNRVNAGIGAPPPDGSFWFQSSASLPDQCDVVRSPFVRLSSTSELSMQTHYQIEPLSTQWYDRANIVFRNAANQGTTLLTPSSGRAYDASGVGGTCGTSGQPGWAGIANQSWAASNWSSAALQTGTLANKPGNLVFRYGTDPGDHRNGFRFDGVSLTNFDVEVADAQSNSCAASNFIFADNFESSTTGQWSNTVP